MRRKKKKVLVVLENQKLVRTFIETKVLTKLNSKYNINYIVDKKNLKKNKIIKKIKNKLFYEITDLNRKLSKVIIRLFYYSNFSKSISYKYRLKRMLNWGVLYNGNLFLPFRYLIFIKGLLSKDGIFYLIILPIISLKIFRNYFYKMILKKVKIPTALDDFLNKNRKNKVIILVPSRGVDFMTLLLDKIKTTYKNVKDIIMIDNWDNISSKGGFWHRPNALVTWGTQSSKDARKIFNLKSNLYEFGTPSYKNYFINRYKKEKKIYNFRYILFSGPTLPFDDLTALKKIDDILQKNVLFKGLKVVYRPHPAPQPRNSKYNFYKKKFKNIILDKDAKQFYQKNLSEPYKTPLNYFPSLIKNSEFIIAPLTTLLIESLIFYKKVLVLLHNDNFHYETPRRTFDNMEHLKILKNHDFLNYSYNFEDLEGLLVSSYKSRHEKNKKKINIFLNKVITNPRNFDKNILKLVNKL